jgi:hypothetical protein
MLSLFALCASLAMSMIGDPGISGPRTRDALERPPAVEGVTLSHPAD